MSGQHTQGRLDYVKNGPLLELIDGHYPCFKNIKGLDFNIAIVMHATNLTAMDGINRQLQAERLVEAWNQHDPLVDKLAAARTLLAEIVSDVPADHSDELTERIRAFLKGQP